MSIECFLDGCERTLTVTVDNPVVSGGTTCDKQGVVRLPPFDPDMSFVKTTSVLKAYLIQTWSEYDALWRICND